MLTLVKHRLPPVWDGSKVKWEKFESFGNIQICPPPKVEPCECGSVAAKSGAAGARQPEPGAMVKSTKRKMGRWGRWVHVPAMVPAWPVNDLYAFHCPDCRSDDVWDMRTDEWWTLGPEDYGPDGSARPVKREWSGGLFDLLPDETESEKNYE